MENVLSELSGSGQQHEDNVEKFEITKVQPMPMRYLTLALFAIAIIAVVLFIANVITPQTFATLIGMLFLSAFAGVNIIRSNYTAKVLIELYSDRIMPGGNSEPVYLNQVKNYSVIYSANHVQLKLIMNDGKVRALGADTNKGFEPFIKAFEDRVNALDSTQNLAITRKPTFVETNRGLAFMVVFTIVYVGATIG